MVIFLYNLYIFVWKQYFWGPPLHHLIFDWLSWGLTTHQLLLVILCCVVSQRKGDEIVVEMKERDRGEWKMNESDETEEIKTFPLYPYLLQG